MRSPPATRPFSPAPPHPPTTTTKNRDPSTTEVVPLPTITVVPFLVDAHRVIAVRANGSASCATATSSAASCSGVSARGKGRGRRGTAEANTSRRDGLEEVLGPDGCRGRRRISGHLPRALQRRVGVGHLLRRQEIVMP